MAVALPLRQYSPSPARMIASSSNLELGPMMKDEYIKTLLFMWQLLAIVFSVGLRIQISPFADGDHFKSMQSIYYGVHRFLGGKGMRVHLLFFLNHCKQKMDFLISRSMKFQKKAP